MCVCMKGECVCTLKCVNANVCALSRSVCLVCVLNYLYYLHFICSLEKGAQSHSHSPRSPKQTLCCLPLLPQHLQVTLHCSANALLSLPSLALLLHLLHFAFNHKNLDS